MKDDIKEQLDGLKILFVEDEEIAREMLENLLLRITDNLIVRKNGEEGLKAYEEYRPDIVISDIKMPRMNGVEMAAKIKEINKNAVIIFITAHKEPMLVVKAVELGIKRFVFKPVRLKQIKEILLGIAKEINVEKELQKKEREIEEERDLTMKILNTQNSIVLLSNRKEGIIRANSRFFECFSFADLEDFKKENTCICDLFVEDDGLIYRQEDIEKIADETRLFERKHVAKAYDKNGSLLIFSIAVERIMLNQLEHFVITLNNITQEEQALEKARDVDKIKSEFFTNMSHEIRTPINGIIGFADLLEESIKQPELVNYATIISSSAKSLLNIINDILDYSKIEEGKLEIEEIPCDIVKEIESVAELFYAESLQKKIDLLLHIDPIFPGCVIGDPLRIRQILSNLISNSIKFTDEGGQVKVEVKYLCNIEDECGQIMISVSDTGIGIPEEKQEKIFEAFSQADTTTTREFGGTGLGLTISSRLVCLLGGKLLLESKVGVGSRFYFNIDIHECESDRVRLPAFKPQRERIVIITNTPFGEGYQQMLLLNYLQTFGYKTAYFSDKELLLKDPDIYDIGFVFDDISIDLFEVVRQKSRKSIFISSFIESQSTLSVDEILHLPIYGTKIYGAIKNVLQIGKHKREKREKLKQRKLVNAHILVVEDNMVNQKLIMVILEKLGARVTLASNGLEAVSAFKNDPFDMILMDINMPIMDGVAATEKILQIEKERSCKHTPIIALTANIQKGDKERYLDVGMDDYLPKPITQSQVEKMLGRYLELGEADEEEVEQVFIESDDTLDVAAAVNGLGVSQEMILELVQEFLDNYDTARSTLAAAIATQDVSNGKQIAHKFKGASGNLRMYKAYESFKSLEESIDKPSKSKELLETIEEEITKIRHRLAAQNSNIS